MRKENLSRVEFADSLFFTVMETKPLQTPPKTMTLVFADLGGGRIACDSKDHQRMIEAFIGHSV